MNDVKEGKGGLYIINCHSREFIFLVLTIPELSWTSIATQLEVSWFHGTTHQSAPRGLGWRRHCQISKARLPCRIFTISNILGRLAWKILIYELSQVSYVSDLSKVDSFVQPKLKKASDFLGRLEHESSVDRFIFQDDFSKMPLTERRALCVDQGARGPTVKISVNERILISITSKSQKIHPQFCSETMVTCCYVLFIVFPLPKWPGYIWNNSLILFAGRGVSQRVAWKKSRRKEGCQSRATFGQLRAANSWKNKLDLANRLYMIIVICHIYSNVWYVQIWRSLFKTRSQSQGTR